MTVAIWATKAGYQKEPVECFRQFKHTLLNHPCFGDVTEVDKLISNLHTELESDFRTYERVDETLGESLISGNIKELVAVIHDAPSDPEMSISETCPVVGSNSIVRETPCTNTGFSSSQKDDVLLNAHEIIAVPAHKETENESCIIMKTVASNGAHHSTTKVSDECTYWGYLVVLPDMSYLSDSHAFDQIFYKNGENLSDESNDDQEPNKILIDADYSSGRLSNNETFKRSDENVSQESNLNDLIYSVSDPHHLVSSSGVSTQCGKYALNRVKLTVAWDYEHPTLFHGGG